MRAGVTCDVIHATMFSTSCYTQHSTVHPRCQSQARAFRILPNPRPRLRSVAVGASPRCSETRPRWARRTVSLAQKRCFLGGGCFLGPLGALGALGAPCAPPAPAHTAHPRGLHSTATMRGGQLHSEVRISVVISTQLRREARISATATWDSGCTAPSRPASLATAPWRRSISSGLAR